MRNLRIKNLKNKQQYDSPACLIIAGVEPLVPPLSQGPSTVEALLFFRN